MKKLSIFLLVLVFCSIAVSAKNVPENFKIAVGDSSPATDVILATKIITALKDAGYEDVPISVTALFSEVDPMAQDQILLVIYHGEVIHVIASGSPTNYGEFASDSKKTVSALGVNVLNTITSSKLKSDNLAVLFGEEETQPEPEDETQSSEDDPSDDETPEQQPQTPTPQPTTQTPVPNLISDDSGCNGCSLGDNCYPIGFRTQKGYCADSGELKPQLEGSYNCNNNFECKSNVCVDGNCVSSSLIRRVMNWFVNLFSG